MKKLMMLSAVAAITGCTTVALDTPTINVTNNHYAAVETDGDGRTLFSDGSGDDTVLKLLTVSNRQYKVGNTLPMGTYLYLGNYSFNDGIDTNDVHSVNVKIITENSKGNN